jgi:hypothetical protein
MKIPYDVFEARDLPEEDKVYLKKGKLGYRVVHPDKPWIGGRKNLFLVFIYIIIAIIIYFGVSSLIDEYRDAAENPCKYCRLKEDFNFSEVEHLRLVPEVKIEGGDDG